MNYEENYDPYERYIQEISKYKKLNDEENKKLLKKYAETKDENIKDQILKGNLFLVIYCLQFYKFNFGMHAMDLIQEGNIALSEAIEKFDLNRTNAFSTYAVVAIKRIMLLYVSKNINSLKTSVHMNNMVYKYICLKRGLEESLNRIPSLEEMAKYMNISIQAAYHCEQLSNPLVSINQKLNDDSEEELGDFIEDETNIDIEETTEENEKAETLTNCLNLLRPIEKNIIVCRYVSEFSLEKTAAILYQKGLTETILTRERIRQIEDKALNKLRSFKVLDKYKINRYEMNPNSIFYFIPSFYQRGNEAIFESLKKGNYNQARQQLEQWNGDYNLNYYRYYGLLEKLENNYNDSIRNYNECFAYMDKSSYIYLEKAILNIDLGNYDVARQILESYGDEMYSFDFKINLICLKILEEKYDEAYDLLMNISKKSMVPKKRYICKVLRTIVKKNISEYKSYCKNVVTDDYLIDCIAHYDFDKVLQYNNKNLKLDESFRTYAQREIINLNANHCYFLDTYKLTLPYSIRNIDGYRTNNVCVSTIIGTKNIVYVDPIILSNDFEKDNKIYVKRN